MALKNMTTPDVGSEEVTVIEILVKPGDRIEKDAPIVTLESDKATMEVPSTDAGVVKEIKVKVGDKVATGSALVTLEASSDDAPTEGQEKPAPSKAKKPAAPQAKQEKQEKPAKQSTQSKETEAEQQPSEGPTKPEKESPHASERDGQPPILTGTLETDSDVHAGPGVRRMARELGVNLKEVPGSGPKARIIKEDIQQFVKRQLSQAPSAGNMPFAQLPTIDFSKFGPVDVQALSRIKKISGKNLQRNWMMIPHVTQFGEADISTLEEFRQSQKQASKDQVKLTPLVFVMKAAVASLRAFPNFNASLEVSGESLVLKKYFHIGVAVDTPEGLVVPVIRDVDKKGLIDLAKELAEVSERARQKQLKPADMQGGCFSISSLGGIGGTAFTPIINYPEVAILGVSRTAYKPVYADGQFVPRLMLPLSLSYDHRVIDGAEGARFIVHLTSMLSDIRNLLL